MISFLISTRDFFAEYSMIALSAIFIENIIFTRALGSSTSLLLIRKKINLFLFGVVIIAMTTISSLIIFFLNPHIEKLSYAYYIRPFIYLVAISIVYVVLLLIISRFRNLRKQILPMIHMSAFNCAVLGALLLGMQTNMTISQFMGFGIGTGIGFVLSTYLISISYEKLYSEKISPAFRGFPATLIYIGILSLAFYGLIGHELPF